MSYAGIHAEYHTYGTNNYVVDADSRAQGKDTRCLSGLDPNKRSSATRLCPRRGFKREINKVVNKQGGKI